MSYKIKNTEIKSSDGIHTLKGVVYIPDGEIKGILHIVHGMCEYIGRYRHILSAAAENGYVAAGYDNLGHGETAENSEELGFVAHKYGWIYLVRDVADFDKQLKEMFPDIPLCLMGHSMGSFMARIAASNFNYHNKLIICGTGGPNPATPFGLLAIDIIKLFKGEKHRSELINKLAFGAYNKRFSGDSAYEWITSDKEVLKQYEADKFCNYKFTLSAMHDLLKLSSAANRKVSFGNMEKNKPVFIISGTLDPVGNYGKGVKTVYEKYKAAGVEDVKIKLYENCRHEIHNDLSSQEVIKDIMEFLKK